MSSNFNSIYASIYDDIYRGKNYFREVNTLIQSAKIADSPHFSKLKLLDFGCGTGNHSIEFAKLGFIVTGIDPSLEMLEIAKKKSQDFKTINLKQGSLEAIPISSLDFDLFICMFNVLGYVGAVNSIESLFEKAFATLEEKKGKFIFDYWENNLVSTNNSPETIRAYQTHLGLIKRKTSSQFVENDLLRILISWEGNMFNYYETKEEHFIRVYNSQEIMTKLQDIGFKSITKVQLPNDKYSDTRGITLVAASKNS